MLLIQKLAVLFGVAGLAPFVATLLIMMFWKDMSLIGEKLFYLYSAGILAFMAGAYWTISMQVEERSYPVSPVSAMLLSQFFFLAAALPLLTPWQVQAVVFPLLYILLFLTDYRAMNSYWPAWYIHLRLLLTTVVVACQVIAAVWLYLP